MKHEDMLDNIVLKHKFSVFLIKTIISEQKRFKNRYFYAFMDKKSNCNLK